jgi:hypothetical protein
MCGEEEVACALSAVHTYRISPWFEPYLSHVMLPLRASCYSLFSDVCTKYQEAAKIVNLALTGIVSQCIPGATVLQLCEFGDTVIKAGVAKLYTKKVDGVAVDRGVAFPVCVSVNDIVCNHSPLETEERVRC